MGKIERIAQQLSKLPEPLQQEVVDFIEFIQAKYCLDQQSQQDTLLLDLKGGLEGSSTFSGDNVKIQERLRDEWR